MTDPTPQFSSLPSSDFLYDVVQGIKYFSDSEFKWNFPYLQTAIRSPMEAFP
jgi:hypothetical protein